MDTMARLPSVTEAKSLSLPKISCVLRTLSAFHLVVRIVPLTSYIYCPIIYWQMTFKVIPNALHQRSDTDVNRS